MKEEETMTELLENPSYRPTADWRRQIGETVVIRGAGRVVRIGTVDDIMPDGSGLWLAADGPIPRAYFHKGDGLELCVDE